MEWYTNANLQFRPNGFECPLKGLLFSLNLSNWIQKYYQLNPTKNPMGHTIPAWYHSWGHMCRWVIDSGLFADQNLISPARVLCVINLMNHSSIQHLCHWRNHLSIHSPTSVAYDPPTIIHSALELSEWNTTPASHNQFLTNGFWCAPGTVQCWCWLPQQDSMLSSLYPSPRNHEFIFDSK